MPDIGILDHLHTPEIAARVRSARLPQAVMLLVIAAAATGGFLATGSHAASQAITVAGPDLTRLLRAMAAMKAMAALGLIAATLWRLATPVTPGKFVGYALAGAAMAAGPGLIWNMAHLKLGALLLHGGLLACVLILWRDPGVGMRLEAIVARRRATLRRSVSGF